MLTVCFCFSPVRIYRCDVSKSSNFFSIVVRNNNGDGLVGQLDASVTFTQNRNSVSRPLVLVLVFGSFVADRIVSKIICGTIGNAGSAIVGTINGLAGGFFGFVQAILCN